MCPRDIYALGQHTIVTVGMAETCPCLVEQVKGDEE